MRKAAISEERLPALLAAFANRRFASETARLLLPERISSTAKPGEPYRIGNRTVFDIVNIRGAPILQSVLVLWLARAERSRLWNQIDATSVNQTSPGGALTKYSLGGILSVVLLIIPFNIPMAHNHRRSRDRAAQG